MPLFRKKPVVIEAMQFAGGADSAVACIRFAALPETAFVDLDGGVQYLHIDTLEGTMRADLGDWIIRGVQGELYPCKPDIFAATYEAVEKCVIDPAQLRAAKVIFDAVREGVARETLSVRGAARDLAEFEAATADLDDEIQLSFADVSAEIDGGLSAEVVETLKADGPATGFAEKR